MLYSRLGRRTDSLPVPCGRETPQPDWSRVEELQSQIHRTTERTKVAYDHVRIDEVIYDLDLPWERCVVRSWHTDGYADWDFQSRSFKPVETDGGWERVA